ncbi:vascular endothelial growth factor D isoform X1 [Gadus chalcogrammus]|uniref:vascular endothelial growth factor D isoform X1 n=1 Tax=Gadus chalcogrammus TaxID=1042646 RepID=UPI0024C4DAAB|nr:vascular endothelial growth factor D isoform X1 [Gadus chalcogrammus]
MRTGPCVCTVSIVVALVMKTSWITAGRTPQRRDSGVLSQELWEKEVRSAGSLDELLRLTDFPDWMLWKCRLRLQEPETQLLASSSSPPSPSSSSSVFSSSSSSLLSSSSPSSSSSAGSHRSTRYAAVSYSLEILKAIDEEWQRTQCMPRETCVDVAKELGTDPSMFFKPPCVSVYRCNGCCNTEGATCRNTTATYVNKTLLSVIPFKFGPEPVLIKVANHTECRCMEPPIIRRNARPPKKRGCSPMHHLADSEDTRRVCATGMLWDCMENRCVPYPASIPEFSLNAWLPDCELDPERCACLPRAPPSRPPLYRCHINATVCSGRRKTYDHRACRCK